MSTPEQHHAIWPPVAARRDLAHSTPLSEGNGFWRGVPKVIDPKADTDEIVGAAVRRIAQRFDAGCLLLRFSSHDTWIHTVAYHADDPMLQSILGKVAAFPRRVPGSALHAAIKREESKLLASERLEEFSSMLSARTRALLQRGGIRALLAVPVRNDGAVAGSLFVVRTGSQPAFTDADREALEREAAALADAPSLREAVDDGAPGIDPPERFGAAFVHAPVGFALFQVGGPNGRWLMDVNPALCDLLRARPDELLSHPAFHELVHPDDAPTLAEYWDRVCTAGDATAELELRLRRLDGTEFEASLQLSMIRDLEGQPLWGLALLQEVPARRAAEQPSAAQTAQERLLGALSRLALYEPNLDRVIDEAAATVAEVLDCDYVRMLEVTRGGEEPVTTSGRGWPTHTPVSDDLARSGAALLGDGGERTIVVDDLDEMTAVQPPVAWGKHGVRSGLVTRVANVDGDLVGCLSALNRTARTHRPDEVSFIEAVAAILGAAIGLRRAANTAQQPVLYDGLTGLPLRRLFMDRVGHALARAGQAQARPAVLMLDLDRFGQVNDAIGYGGGDEVLRAATARLARVLRNEATLARLGSDEFGVLCENVEGEGGALRTAERLLEALADPVTVDDREIAVSASIGVVVAEPGARSPETLVGGAELAMYRAKDCGGARTAIFEPGMRRRAGERARLESDLRRAIENDEFEVHYQPIVHLEDPRILAVEALLRWNHPERGLVSPAAFVPVAEETGLIVPIGRWVLREACRQLALWRSDPAIDLPYVSVNLSGRQLAEASLPGEIAATLQQTGVAPEHVALELTESVLMEESSSPTAMLQQLKGLGVRLMLDDFGTGYSSLNYVKRFPVEAIKVDRSFLADVADDEASRNLLRAIVTMASALGMEVVAEGVEDDDQLRWMRRLGFTMAQGYGLCRPAPPARLTEVLRQGLDVQWLRDVPRLEDDAVEPPPIEDAREETPSVTLGEAAEALGVSASTLRRWADSGRIRAIRTAGGHRRFPTTEVRRLAASSSTLRRPVVRNAQLPVTALPCVAALLAERSREIAAGAGRSLYEPSRGGWFATPAAAEPIGRWLADLAGACGAGGYEEVATATRRLAATAGYAGASVLERHDFVDRFGEIALRRLQEAQAPRDELIGLRRLVLRMRQVVLEEASATG
jgi:diguanylate cyclase (GGDEF)-like protein/excisionase family DNA binding protein/PAS domain S-box-containing protein